MKRTLSNYYFQYYDSFVKFLGFFFFLQKKNEAYASMCLEAYASPCPGKTPQTRLAPFKTLLRTIIVPSWTYGTPPSSQLYVKVEIKRRRGSKELGSWRRQRHETWKISFTIHTSNNSFSCRNSIPALCLLIVIPLTTHEPLYDPVFDSKLIPSITKICM